MSYKCFAGTFAFTGFTEFRGTFLHRNAIECELPEIQLQHCAALDFLVSQHLISKGAATQRRDGKVPLLISFPTWSSYCSPAARSSPALPAAPQAACGPQVLLLSPEIRLRLNETELGRVN